MERGTDNTTLLKQIFGVLVHKIVLIKTSLREVEGPEGYLR